MALSREVLDARGATDVLLLVDDLLDSKLTGPYDMVVDKGTFDACGLMSDRERHRATYREAVSRRARGRGGERNAVSTSTCLVRRRHRRRRLTTLGATA